jgi:hypothetical protein
MGTKLLCPEIHPYYKQVPLFLQEKGGNVFSNIAALVCFN